jgi:preprotein translocase subunit SecB
MTENYKILAKFIKDVSAETPDIETYIFVKNYIAKYNLHIDITSLAVKDRVIEINTKLSLSDPNESEKKIYFEIIYATVVKIDETIKNSKEIEKIVVCDVQNKIYPELEKIFLKLIVDSGYPEPKPNKKIDFEELFKNKNN